MTVIDESPRYRYNNENFIIDSLRKRVVMPLV